MDEILNRLNSRQQEAVMHTDGPLLILAGAGSGKTTVLVNRLAYILKAKNVRPSEILAITFTNKAANEMKERVAARIGNLADSMWISTFHSACVRILRNVIDYAGYTKSFVIYDSADAKTLIKECIKEIGLDEKAYPPRAVAAIISNAKDDMITPEMFANRYVNDLRLNKVAEVYSLYQKRLKNNNALDFDDILMITVKIFAENPDVLNQYRERFRYIMVDEYQDTNNAQYMLIYQLASKHRNICVVGDDDQSIYKFRGANIANILNFEKDYKDATVIKLEQNYRSTQIILDVANAVISNNEGRKGKKLWTDSVLGEKVSVFTAQNERDEGKFIADTIRKGVMEGRKYSDFTVLYRTNAQSRAIEEMLLRNGVAYKIFGGQRFYDRKEIKDIIAYLRVVHNPNDDISIKRIINEPKRGIGTTSMSKASTLASGLGTDLFSVIENATEYEDLSRSAAKMKDFAKFIREMQLNIDAMPLPDFIMCVMQESGYIPMLEFENSIESKTRIDNINEFLSAADYYAKNEPDPTLGGFLESITLISDVDDYDEGQDTCSLMTIHSAKGLEFPVVFIAGFENGLFPSSQSIGEREELEEERRLCYVAITRAKQKLYITKTQMRTIFGKTTPAFKSMFYDEIPPMYIDDITKRPEQKLQQAFSKSKHEASVIPTLSKPSVQKSENIHNFAPGDTVMHKKFGLGTVISVTNFEKDSLLDIKFDSAGSKKLMAAFAKLEKL